MTLIRVLPEILSNKIAAGEVVERPASVVKELVENALDAGGTRIAIDIEKGGRSLIRVADNGGGMSPDDALLSIERYATSKIYHPDDLFAIKTLGFRGEALPSIASVSRFSLITRDKDSDAGTEIRIDGGKIIKVSAVGAPSGTMVTVKQLFFNVPARRKFLKQIATEMGHIVEVVTGMALGHSRVGFKLLHNGRPLKNWSAAADAFERVVMVLGGDVRQNLFQVRVANEYLHLEGWIGSPRETRTTSRSIFVFVNGRIVKDRLIRHALLQAYAGRIMKGQFPLAVLFLKVPPETVDVNVHPTKHEVRFVHHKQVHDAVRDAASAVLSRASAVKWGRNTYAPMPADTKKGATTDASFIPDDRTATVSERTEIYAVEGRAFRDAKQLKAPMPPSVPIETPAEAVQPENPEADIISREINSKEGFNPPPSFRNYRYQQEIWRRDRFADLKVIGQFQDVYLVCEAGEDLILIDQHAAHERILYEKLRRQSESTVQSQRLLMPEAVDFGYRESGVLEKMIPQLESLGFSIEHFGGETYRIQAAPALLAGRAIKPLLTEIVEKLIEYESNVAGKALDDMLKIMACHGAIRANQRLAPAEIKTMLKQLDACEQPSNCPHGRPTWIRLERRFIEKSFKRIV